MLFFRKNDKDEICGLFLIDEREIQGGFFFFFFFKKRAHTCSVGNGFGKDKIKILCGMGLLT